MREKLQKNYGVDLDEKWNALITDAWNDAQRTVGFGFSLDFFVMLSFRVFCERLMFFYLHIFQLVVRVSLPFTVTSLWTLLSL